MKFLKALLMSVTAAIGLIFATAAPSAAALPPDGKQVTCGTAGMGLGLYYNSGVAGSKRCIFGNVSNYAYNGTACTSQACPPYAYELDGKNGEGKLVKNNTASVYNYSPFVVRVYVNSGWGGSWDSFPNYGYQGSSVWYGNLNTTYNNNASQFMVYQT
ncbi:hypothetical protein AB0C52_30505 [Streptomyces sp. NPDC048717]|uniref:hypothetical protein n=1 Tax=unclassified Streptomyces TaxID=2593676 RepID=UPI00341C0076